MTVLPRYSNKSGMAVKTLPDLAAEDLPSPEQAEVLGEPPDWYDEPE